MWTEQVIPQNSSKGGSLGRVHFYGPFSQHHVCAAGRLPLYAVDLMPMQSLVTRLLEGHRDEILNA